MRLSLYSKISFSVLVVKKPVFQKFAVKFSFRFTVPFGTREKNSSKLFFSVHEKKDFINLVQLRPAADMAPPMEKLSRGQESYWKELLTIEFLSMQMSESTAE